MSDGKMLFAGMMWGCEGKAIHQAIREAVDYYARKYSQQAQEQALIVLVPVGQGVEVEGVQVVESRVVIPGNVFVGMYQEVGDVSR